MDAETTSLITAVDGRVNAANTSLLNNVGKSMLLVIKIVFILLFIL